MNPAFAPVQWDYEKNVLIGQLLLIQGFSIHSHANALAFPKFVQRTKNSTLNQTLADVSNFLLVLKSPIPLVLLAWSSALGLATAQCPVKSLVICHRWSILTLAHVSASPAQFHHLKSAHLH